MVEIILCNNLLKTTIPIKRLVSTTIYKMKQYIKVIVTVKSSGCPQIGCGVLIHRLCLQLFDITPQTPVFPN